MPILRREFLAGMLPLLTRRRLDDTRPAAAATPSDGDERIIEALKPIRLANGVPGLIAGIAIPGRATRVGAVGVRKVRSPEGFGAGDLVHLGSCTKAMTATMIGGVVEEGKLAWKSTLSEVFPDVAMHEDFRRVTLTQLLTHRSGMPANTNWWGLQGATTTLQRRDALQAAVKTPPKEKPGTKFLYSNLGYAIAGLMAETVTNRPWEDLMRDRVFSPLRMTSAGFGAPGMRGEVDQPWGHVRVLGQAISSQRDNAPALGPAGTVHCTMSDWAKFLILHVNGARGDKTPILCPETFRELQTPPPGETYAKGWHETDRPWAGGRTLTHTGSNTSWFCTAWIAPQRNFALFSAANEGGVRAATATDQAVAAMIDMVGDAEEPVRL